MDGFDAVRAQRAASEAFSGGGDGLALLVGGIDARQYVVGAMAHGELALDDRINPGEVAFGEDDGLDRRTSGRHLIKEGKIEIRKQAHREASWDRRCRHHQEIGFGALRLEARPVEDAEAMLFVDDREAEAVEADAFLDDRVGAEDDRERAGGEVAQRGCAGGAGYLAGE